MMIFLSLLRLVAITFASTAAILYFDGVVAAVLTAYITVCAGAWLQRSNNAAREYQGFLARGRALLQSLGKPSRRVRRIKSDHWR